MDEQMNNNEGTPRRDSDEMSVASDFSIIPESFAGAEELSPGEQANMASDVSSFRVDHFKPSLSAETSFGKVLFQNIQATYTADSDIAVSYVLTESVTGKSSDRVALYRVGFGSPQDYLTYQWAPTPSKDHTTNQLPVTVVFKATSLPKDAGEFFQFCYVTHEGQIVGVSTPFQLHPVGSSSVCGMDDGEDGMVVVSTKESIMHDKINKLSEDYEKLSSELSKSAATCETKQIELDDKIQQLNMCQHHLQALETKMKKETAEKCELMGRVGQVVEEKGHLEDRVKTLERNLDSSVNQMEALEKKLAMVIEEKNNASDDVLQLRKVKEQLEHALKKCQADLSHAEDTILSLQSENKQIQHDREKAIKDLEFWTCTASTDKEEKNSLALKFSTVNEELITKLEELEKSKNITKELEEKLTVAVVEMTCIKDNLTATESKLIETEEERTVHEERLNVVNQDNDQLKVTIQQLKNKIESWENVQENEESVREAAERIASDLSGRLQVAKAEYHALALTNLRLAKKIKKMRQSASPEVDREKLTSMSTSVDSQCSSWLNVDEVKVNAEKAEDPDEDMGSEVAASMIQSCTSGLTTTTCSNCSHSTQLLSEVVNKKMEDIVRELSLQIQSLKTELKTREREQQVTSSEQESLNSNQEQNAPNDVSEEPQSDGTIHQEEENNEEENNEEEPQQQAEALPAEVAQSQVTNRAPDTQTEASSAENSADQQVLYSNSFLPAQRTAPVFLPERERERLTYLTETGGQEHVNPGPIRPSAPSPTPSMLSQRSQTTTVTVVSTPVSGSNLVIPITPKAHLPVTRTPPQPLYDSSLPPPLLPETTSTARQAAVMSQFSSQQMPGGLGHESDDDDFHSTSDNDDTTNIPNDVRMFSCSSSSLFECPMCGLSFQPGAIGLLEEHINSHLEHVCPVCSMAFQRNCSKSFEEHVHSHFGDEAADDDNPLDDSSGPWGPQYRAARLLEID